VDAVGDRARLRLGGSVPLVAEVTMMAIAELAVREGATIWASLKATEVRVVPR
jgi:molybdate transport system ATP-binding protein